MCIRIRFSRSLILKIKNDVIFIIILEKLVLLQSQSYVDYQKIQRDVRQDMKSREMSNRVTDTVLKRAWINLQDGNIP